MAWDRMAYNAALAALVVLAGCGTIAGSDRSIEKTVTPAPLPTDGAEFPPGISNSGVAPDVVTDTHERRMSGTNYTFRSRQRVVGPNGTMWVTNRTRRIDNEASAYTGRIDHNVTEFPLGRFSAPIEYWGNDSVYASRRILTDRTSFYGWSRTDQTDTFASLPLIERTLTATRVSVVSRAGGVTLVGDSFSDPQKLPSPPYLENPRNGSLTVRVTDRGVVTRWRFAYDATLANETVRVTRRARLTDIGSTVVERPPWVDAARAEMLSRQEADDA